MVLILWLIGVDDTVGDSCGVFFCLKSVGLSQAYATACRDKKAVRLIWSVGMLAANSDDRLLS